MKDILIATTKDYENNKLFDLSDTRLNRDNCLEPNVALKEAFKQKGFDLKTFDQGDPRTAEHIIFFEVGHAKTTYEQCVKAGLKDKMSLIIWEPPVVSPLNYEKTVHDNFKKVFTWMDSLVDNKNHFKFYWPQPMIPANIPNIPFSQRKLATLIAGNKTSNYPGELYSERLNSIKVFSKIFPNDFDFYGMGWERDLSFVDSLKERMFPSYYRSYKGKVEDKYSTLANYRFSICYENMKDVSGYFTEKLFDSFKAGCIPVYWGASNIKDLVPSECFIDRRDFKSNNELAEYLNMLDEKFFNATLNNIKEYLTSDKYALFSNKNFSKTITEGLLGK